MTETQIMRDILVAVTSLPDGVFWRTNSGVAVTPARSVVRFNVPGTPDILGCYRGRAVAIEAKAAIGRQSHQQRRFQAAWERAGGLYVLARSVDDAMAALR